MKTKITLREKYGPAMEITSQASADAYFEKCVQHNLKCRRIEGKHEDRADAERIEKSNLAYYAGYYDEKTRKRVERLFKCAHPVFGAIEQNGPPTTEAAFEIGKRIGEALTSRESK